MSLYLMPILSYFFVLIWHKYKKIYKWIIKTNKSSNYKKSQENTEQMTYKNVFEIHMYAYNNIFGT